MRGEFLCRIQKFGRMNSAMDWQDPGGGNREGELVNFGRGREGGLAESEFRGRIMRMRGYCWQDGGREEEGEGSRTPDFLRESEP